MSRRNRFRAGRFALAVLSVSQLAFAADPPKPVEVKAPAADPAPSIAAEANAATSASAAAAAPAPAAIDASGAAAPTPGPTADAVAKDELAKSPDTTASDTFTSTEGCE